MTNNDFENFSYMMLNLYFSNNGPGLVEIIKSRPADTETFYDTLLKYATTKCTSEEVKMLAMLMFSGVIAQVLDGVNGNNSLKTRFQVTVGQNTQDFGARSVEFAKKYPDMDHNLQRYIGSPGTLSKDITIFYGSFNHSSQNVGPEKSGWKFWKK